MAGGDLVIRNAHILTMDDLDTEWPQADILIEKGRIVSIGPGAAATIGGNRRQEIDATGQLALPGLINGHFHSPGNLMKGTLDGLPLEIFMLYEVPPLDTRIPLKRLNYVRTMLGAIEMVRTGITAVHDDAFHVPTATAEGIDGIMQAYADSGMRANVAIDQPNVVEYEKYPFLAELLPAEARRAMELAPRQSSQELLDLYAHLISRWHGAADGRLHAAISCSAPQRVTIPYLQALSALSRKHDLAFNIHILETKLQRVLGRERYGKSLVRYVHDLGCLDERMLVIHAIWIDEDDIVLLRESGCTVAHNPICNLRLGSGVMPFRQLREAGIPICLGTDEATVDDAINMWAVAKMAAILHTISDPDYRKWPQAPEILRAMFTGGARGMRRGGEIGALAPGRAADIVLLDLDTVAFTPLNDLRRQLVYCENGSSVRTTIVDGRVVFDDGKLRTVDEHAIRSEANELMAAFRSDFALAIAAAQKLEPYYREMYLKAAATDVGFSRWVAGK